MTFRLFSTELRDGGSLLPMHTANGFGHNGDNRSPHLAWDGVPDGTKSLVLTVYDPDAPTGSGFWHWVVVDIPPYATELRPGAGTDTVPLPFGARQMRNDAGIHTYLGAAPPPGESHRYVLTLHAVSVDVLPVPDDAGGTMVGFVTHMHRLGEARLMVSWGG